MGIQARVAQALKDTSWIRTRKPIPVDTAIRHALGNYASHNMLGQEFHYSMQHVERDYQIMASREQDKESERLGAEYAAEIEGWDWEAVKREAASNAEPDDGYGADDDQLIGRVFLGTVMALAPSGKYYMPWCTNQTSTDELRDAAYFEALEAAASAAGGWIENGEGDPCDVFFCVHVDNPESEAQS